VKRRLGSGLSEVVVGAEAALRMAGHAGCLCVCLGPKFGDRGGGAGAGGARFQTRVWIVTHGRLLALSLIFFFIATARV